MDSGSDSCRSYMVHTWSSSSFLEPAQKLPLKADLTHTSSPAALFWNLQRSCPSIAAHGPRLVQQLDAGTCTEAASQTENTSMCTGSNGLAQMIKVRSSSSLPEPAQKLPLKKEHTSGLGTSTPGQQLVVGTCREATPQRGAQKAGHMLVWNICVITQNQHRQRRWSPQIESAQADAWGGMLFCKIAPAAPGACMPLRSSRQTSSWLVHKASASQPSQS